MPTQERYLPLNHVRQPSGQLLSESIPVFAKLLSSFIVLFFGVIQIKAA